MLSCASKLNKGFPSLLIKIKNYFFMFFVFNINIFVYLIINNLKEYILINKFIIIYSRSHFKWHIY